MPTTTQQILCHVCHLLRLRCPWSTDRLPGCGVPPITTPNKLHPHRTHLCLHIALIGVPRWKCRRRCIVGCPTNVRYPGHCHCTLCNGGLHGTDTFGHFCPSPVHSMLHARHCHGYVGHGGQCVGHLFVARPGALDARVALFFCHWGGSFPIGGKIVAILVDLRRGH